jgi:hypothetical protein
MIPAPPAGCQRKRQANACLPLVGKIAATIINHCGDEVLKVFRTPA